MLGVKGDDGGGIGEPEAHGDLGLRGGGRQREPKARGLGDKGVRGGGGTQLFDAVERFDKPRRRVGAWLHEHADEGGGIGRGIEGHAARGEEGGVRSEKGAQERGVEGGEQRRTGESGPVKRGHRNGDGERSRPLKPGHFSRRPERRCQWPCRARGLGNA